MLDIITEQPKKKEMSSAEWQAVIEIAKAQKHTDYTVIYKDIDGELKEAWHYLCDMNLESVKEAYAEAKKQIIYFGPKELAHGEYLKQATGRE